MFTSFYYLFLFSFPQASWDEPTQTVVMHHGAEPTLLQSLALQLAEKVQERVPWAESRECSVV